MQEQDGSTYQASPWSKSLFATGAKAGKTSFLVAQALGVFPGQKYGGVVESPSDLTVVTFDESALGHLNKFLVESCKAPPEALGFKVLNLEEDMRQAFVSQDEYDFGLYSVFMAAVTKHFARTAGQGVPTLIVSSLTGLALGLERSLMGPPKKLGNGKASGTGADENKWGVFKRQIQEIRSYAQQEKGHCMWEAHMLKKAATETEPEKDTIQISGQSGTTFAVNVAQVFQIRRNFGVPAVQGMKPDVMYLDTRPTWSFIANGRGYTENLEPKEPDLTVVFKKLGLKIGRWGSKKS